MRVRIAVDRVRCGGRGVCAELLPELISLDDWGYPVVAARGVPDHLLPVARLAVSSCPMMALRLGADARAGDACTHRRFTAKGHVAVRHPQHTDLRRQIRRIDTPGHLCATS